MTRTIELMRVQTTLGNRIYPQDTRLYSNVGEKELHIRKYAADLKEGEMILWHNEGIEKTLEQVEPHLQQSERYQKAEQAVYAVNGKGQKIPRFRVELIKALAAKGIVTANGDLEQKIMRENGSDFTAQQYSAMKQFLYGELQQIGKEDSAPTRSADAIEDWLKGQTVAPLDSNVLYSLALATGSQTFDQWWMSAKDSATSSTGFWGAYKFYTTLRQTIMRYLARSKGELAEKARENGNGHKKETGLELTPEIQIVLHQFMQEIDEEFSLARVVGVEKMPIELKEWHRQKAEQAQHPLKLAKGAYTGEEREGMKTLSLMQILEGANFFAHTLIYVFQDYFQGCRSGKYRMPEKALCVTELEQLISQAAHPVMYKGLAGAMVALTSAKLGLIQSASMGVRAGFKKDGDPMEDAINIDGARFLVYDKEGNNQYPKLRELLAGPLSEWIITGKLDTELGLEPFTVYRAMQDYARLQNAIPKSYEAWVFTMRELGNPVLDKQTRRDLENKQGRLGEKVQRQYLLDSDRVKTLLVPELFQLYWARVMAEVQSVTPKNAGYAATEGFVRNAYDALLKSTRPLFEKLHNPNYVAGDSLVKDLQKEYGNTYFTRAECAATLEKHGLAGLMRFIPKANFVLDKEGGAVAAEARQA
ncbi:hypothetical protein HYU17_03670 [Candidatus Woesearchaeota archaeon]|nr:hypothetical protein [Candidatus Woesearchaeota archaeon]